MFPSLFFQFSDKVQLYVYLFAFFYFLSVVNGKGKIHEMTTHFFLDKENNVRSSGRE